VGFTGVEKMLGWGMARLHANSKTESGFVLVAVIWLVGLMAVVATAFILTVRSHSLILRNVVTNTKAQYVADAMVRAKAWNLSIGLQMKLNGEIDFCRWSKDVQVGYRIQDQAGLVDLNMAWPDLMFELFSGLGQSPRQSDILLKALNDFRDPDLVSVNGSAEPINYPNKSFGPKNAPFALAAEIDQLPQVSDELKEQLLPLVTVYSPQQGFDATRAPSDLLRILNIHSADGNRFGSPSPSKIFAIDVVAKTEAGAKFYRKAIVELILQPDRPFTILEWQQGRDASNWTFPKSDAKPCIN
jgi:general secretion pathway protein K